MPTIVKKGMSVTILTTIFTGLGLGIITWFGKTSLEARDTRIDVNYVKAQMDTLNLSMREFIAISHDHRVALQKHELKIEHCESQIEDCRRIIDDK